MKIKIKILLFVISIFSFSTLSAQNVSIIPEPVHYQSNDETFVFGDLVTLNIQTTDKQTIKYTNQFKMFLENAGIKVTNVNNKANKGNTLNIILSNSKDKDLSNEGYNLTVNTQSITLLANQAAGIFNGFQTLKQLLPSNLKSSKRSNSRSVKINGCVIKDYPRFGWRGLMLDVSRHFFTVDEVKTYINKMSQYKFNVFHWHLTDDNGWRIEIKSFPKLTEVGAWRVERYGRFEEHRKEPQSNEKTSYGGYYTQEEIKEVIQYAADRNIMIVPEIDVPGHSMALLAAYPELSTNKKPIYVSPGNKFAEWHGNGSFKMLVENTLNPADEKVYKFLDKVFSEVADLFPCEYIHMGGDECYHGYWEENSAVKKFMKKNNIANGDELQSYFVKRVEKIISSKGKKMIGWDEILIGGIAKNAAVMSWRGMKGGIEAAKMGHNVVMTPTTYAYLDYTQGDYSVENKIYKDLSLENTYTFEPVPDDVDAKYILGGQGNLWTEAIPNLQFAFYMTYPRAFALSETFWSPKDKKNWDYFLPKVEAHFQRFDSVNTNICKAVYDPKIRIYSKGNKMMCELTNSIPNTEIFYTIDNTYPVKFGIKYSGPFEIPKGDLSLRARTYLNNLAIGRTLQIHRKELEKRMN